MGSTNAPFDIQTAIQVFNPTKFNRDEALLYCVGNISDVHRTAFYGRSDPYELSPKDKKLVRQRLVEDVLTTNNLNALVHVDKRRVILKTSQDLPWSLMQGQSRYSALVIVWNGRGSPPAELGTALFKRVYHDRALAARKELLRYHWTSVEILPGYNLDIEKKWNELSTESGSIEFDLHVVPVVMETTLFTLLQMLLQARGADPVTAQRSNEIVQALLLNEQESGEHMIVHGNQLFDTKAALPLLGLAATPGQSRKLSLNATEPALPIVQRSNKSKLFLPEKSVADFLIDYYGSSQNVTLLSAKDLEQVLCGKSVRFRTASGQVVKPIEQVSSLTPNTISNRNDLHPFYRGKTNPLIRYPNFPFINVGNKDVISLLPPEMCNFLPNQSFKQLGNPVLSHALTTSQKSVAGLSPGDFQANQISIVLTLKGESKEERREKLNHSIRNIFEHGATISFAEAGVGSMESPLWAGFREFLSSVSCLKDNRSVTIQQSNPIVLSLKPGEDPAEIWRQQLQSWKNNRCADSKAVLVVAVRSDQYHSQMYRTIKFLADIVVGVQCYFVKMETLEQKVEKNPQKGLEMAAKEVVRRIAVRNPAPPRFTDVDVEQDIAVSLHIGQVNRDVSEVNVDGQCRTSSRTKYLVVFSSRHSEKSTGYHTTTHLGEARDLDRHNLRRLLHDFFNSGSINLNTGEGVQTHVTILRSGFVPTLPKTKICSAESFSSRHLEDFERKDMFIPGSQGPASRNEIINSEVAELHDEVKQHFGESSSMSYVLLSQEKDFTFLNTAKNTIATEVSKVAGSDPSIRFFITDTAVNPDINTIGAHHQVQSNTNASMITLTLLGDPLDHGVEAPFSKRPVSPRNPQINLTIDDDSDTPHDSAFVSRSGSPQKNGGKTPRNTTSLKPAAQVSSMRRSSATAGLIDRLAKLANSQDADVPPTNISNLELQRLAKLWVDDHLDLYDTKWPIPTHLALLVFKRAQMHIIEGSRGRPGELHLEDVKRDVRPTLYYL